MSNITAIYNYRLPDQNRQPVSSVLNTLLNLFLLCPILLAITSVSLGFIRLTELLRFSFRLYPKGFEGRKAN
jgi:hypothetical protein